MEFGSSHKDILVEILSRVPTKSLLTSKCVSKGWHTTISDASFQRLQFQRSKPVISGFMFQDLFDQSDKIKYVPIDNDQVVVRDTLLDFLPEDVRLFSSSNGLICCRNFGVDDQLVYVCNPVRKEYARIEGPYKDDHILQGLVLAYEPCCYSVDEVPHFKLVGISRSEGTDFHFHVYSSKTREWKMAEDVFYCTFSLACGGRGVYAGGVVYWMTRGDTIIAFDVEKEQSRCIHLPVPRIERGEGLSEMCIGESEGSLHYILISDAGLQVWVLNGEQKWILKHSISLPALEEEYPHFVYNEGKRASTMVIDQFIMPPWIEPIAFTDGIVLIKLRSHFCHDSEYLAVSTRIYSYNIDKRTMEELCPLEEMGLYIGYLRTIPYSMSFAPLTFT